MLSRRTVLGAMAMSASATKPSAQTEAIQFGVIADPQYADAPPNLKLDRFYANSLAKLEAAVTVLNAQPLRFVATLGDVIDRDAASFARILPIYARLRHSTRFVLGNHDFSVDEGQRDGIPALLGMPARSYDFAVGNLRFVVLDGNDVSLFGPTRGEAGAAQARTRLMGLTAAGAANAKPWNATLSPEQFAWLDERLDGAEAAGERVIVLNHYPVLPDNPHNLWDAQRLTALLCARRCVVAYFNGHNHAGNYAERDGVHFVNFHGMVDTPDETAFATVAVEGARMTITGYGREPSRVLELRRG